MSVGDIDSEEKGSGARYNKDKPDFSLIPLCTLEGEVRVWMFGEKKYKRFNWMKGMNWSIPYSCAMRHMAAHQAGESKDPDSGESHISHAICNLRMLELYEKVYPEGDDREKVFIPEYFSKK